MPRVLLTLPRPDDFHLHLRQNGRSGDMLSSILSFSADIFGRATIMPNLVPPITSGDMAQDYKAIITQNLTQGQEGPDFTPLMTLYLHASMNPEQIIADYKAKKFFAIKYYPKGATTNSEQGIDDMVAMTPVLQAMEQAKIPLLIHGEAVGRGKDNRPIDIFDREKVFIEGALTWLLEKFPGLKISMEHITTRHAVNFLRAAGNNVGASITAHHLLIDRNAMFYKKTGGASVAGLNPHHYCLPVAKRAADREALLELATSGFPRVYGGTDSAPHARDKKESDCGCAGIFSAPVAVEAYYLAFQEANKISALENFLCNHGADFFALNKGADSTAAARGKIAITQQEWQVPEIINIANSATGIVPFMAGEVLPIKAIRLA